MSTPVTTSLNPWGKPVSQANVVRSHPRGRICAQDGCNTILSIYNPASYCSAHTKEAQSGRRPVEAHPLRDVACENCGAVFETRDPHHRYCSDRCRAADFARRKRAAQRSVPDAKR